MLAVGIILSTAPLLNMIRVQSVGLSKRQSFHLLICDLLYFLFWISTTKEESSIVLQVRQSEQTESVQEYSSLPICGIAEFQGNSTSWWSFCLGKQSYCEQSILCIFLTFIKDWVWIIWIFLKISSFGAKISNAWPQSNYSHLENLSINLATMSLTSCKKKR